MQTLHLPYPDDDKRERHIIIKNIENIMLSPLDESRTKWVVSAMTKNGYYPHKFDTYELALERYEEILKEITDCED